VIVVHPHQVAGTIALRDHVGVASIDRLVDVPPIDVQRQLIDAVVADRPENGVGDVLVEDLHFGSAEENGYGTKCGQLSVDFVERLGPEPVERTRPPDPQTPRLLVRPTKACREPTRASAHGGSAVPHSKGDRQSIRDNE
jgi:hypothetical protein